MLCTVTKVFALAAALKPNLMAVVLCTRARSSQAILRFAVADHLNFPTVVPGFYAVDQNSGRMLWRTMGGYGKGVVVLTG